MKNNFTLKELELLNDIVWSAYKHIKHGGEGLVGICRSDSVAIEKYGNLIEKIENQLQSRKI